MPKPEYNIELSMADLALLVHALESHLELRKMQGGSGYWQDRKQTQELIIKLTAPPALDDMVSGDPTV